VNDVLDLTEYYIFKGKTNDAGEIDIFFDDLRDNSTYDIYVTAGSDLIYDPP